MLTSLYMVLIHTDSTQTNTNLTWKNRTNNLLSSMSVFFTGANDTEDTSAPGRIMTEVACEPVGTCDSDNYAFKGLTAQWMGEAAQIAPFTTDKISGYLQSSAEAAAAQCSGGHNGTACGSRWTRPRYDGKTGLGQELSAMNVFLANLAVNSSAPTTTNTTAATQAKDASQSPSPSPSSSTTVASGSPTATSSRPSSGSQRLWAASWTVMLVIPAALLSSWLL